MMTRWVRRRTLLGTGTAAAGAGLFGGKSRGATASLATALSQFQPSVSEIAQNALARLPTTAPLLMKLDVSSALLAILTDLPSAILAGGGLKHQALVRRLRNPALLKIASNPNFVPQGPAFSAVEQRLYNPRLAHGNPL